MGAQQDDGLISSGRPKQTGCAKDTDGDGNCQDHPQGCPGPAVQLEPAAEGETPPVIKPADKPADAD